MLNDTVQIGPHGNSGEQQYVWIIDKIAALRGMDSGEQLSKFLANPERQHIISLPLSKEPLKSAIELLRKMIGCNFIPSILTLASVSVNCHFEYFQSKFRICPVVVAVGDPQSGKTTSLRVAAAFTGSPSTEQFSEVIDAYAAKQLSESTTGLIVDSLSSKSVGRLTVRQFNNLARGTLTAV